MNNNVLDLLKREFNSSDLTKKIKEYTDCDFKKDRKNDPTYLDYLEKN